MAEVMIENDNCVVYLKVPRKSQMKVSVLTTESETENSLKKTANDVIN